MSKVRQHIDVPIVLFTYLNPLLKFGCDRLAEAVKGAGIDGVLITDLVPDEAGPWITAFRGHSIDLIFLIAPTTSDERLTRIARQASGFIYAVSRAGVTGARNELPRDAEPLVRRARTVSDLPIAVGFGISTAEQVRRVWRFADAAVIGSAIVSQIEKLADSPELVDRIGEFARSLLRTQSPPREFVD